MWTREREEEGKKEGTPRLQLGGVRASEIGFYLNGNGCGQTE